MSAMKLFLSDYEKGKAEGRYSYHELPHKLPYKEDSFDIGLVSLIGYPCERNSLYYLKDSTCSRQLCSLQEVLVVIPCTSI